MNGKALSTEGSRRVIPGFNGFPCFITSINLPDSRSALAWLFRKSSFKTLYWHWPHDQLTSAAHALLFTVKRFQYCPNTLMPELCLPRAFQWCTTLSSECIKHVIREYALRFPISKKYQSIYKLSTASTFFNFFNIYSHIAPENHDRAQRIIAMPDRERINDSSI